MDTTYFSYIATAVVPDQVQKVADAFRASAMKAAEQIISHNGETGQDAENTRSFWKNRLYINPSPRGGKPAWLIGDNYDRGPSLIFYPEEGAWARSESIEDSGSWYYMPSYGEEEKIAGGFEEALSNATIMWTG
ncbi:MAG: hypothetical protein ACYSWP_11140 [Planctomycetota bacterium]|jgi:hypothetical protein